MMLYNDYTTKLLDMEHMTIRNIEVYPDRLIICGSCFIVA